MEIKSDQQKPAVSRLIQALAILMSLYQLFTGFYQLTAMNQRVTHVTFGLVLIFLRAKSAGIARFYFLGGVSMLLGLALSVSGLPNGYSLGLFYGSMGICFLLTGGVTLGRYLHDNPVAAESQDE